jgi:hypothetical protein
MLTEYGSSGRVSSWTVSTASVKAQLAGEQREQGQDEGHVTHSSSRTGSTARDLAPPA